MLPQEALGIEMPNPKKLSEDSVRMALATPRLAANDDRAEDVGQDVFDGNQHIASAQIFGGDDKVALL